MTTALGEVTAMAGRDNHEPVETPIDLAAVQADDTMLDMLGAAGASSAGTDAELDRVLMTWRADVATEPIPELVDTDTALAVIAEARKRPMSARDAVSHVVLFAGVWLVAGGAGWAAVNTGILPLVVAAVGLLLMVAGFVFLPKVGAR